MKTRLSIGAALALLQIALPAIAVAATATAPNDGFINVPDPEWAPGHANTENVEGHRAYHREGEQLHLQWHNENTLKGAEYAAAHREFHMMRNAEHRFAHAEAALATKDNTSGVESVDVIQVPLEEAIDTTPSTYHRYEGTKPTPRSIREAAEAQFAR